MGNLPVRTNPKKGKTIEIFSDGCRSCVEHIQNVEIGKCAGCKMIIYQMGEQLDRMTREKSELYQVKVYPTTVIDQEIKIEGVPNFYWLCGNEFYDRLKTEYPLNTIGEG
ncbi:MAG: thioredoxin family protein [Candidatus Kariarchaeaceae archaeon]|jgi:hypothetical protein